MGAIVATPFGVFLYLLLATQYVPQDQNKSCADLGKGLAERPMTELACQHAKSSARIDDSFRIGQKKMTSRAAENGVEAGENRARPVRSLRVFLLPLAVILLATLAFAGYRLWRQPPQQQAAKGIDVDLSSPDFLLSTRNLAHLPKAVADTPLLGGLVDEQLVFHYEEDEARLSVEGAVRRLAYEHDLDLSDRFIATVLSAPAEVGVWRGYKGRPEHFVAVIERGVLGKLAETLAKIVASDAQLKLAGAIKTLGSNIPVYALNYGGGRSLAFAAKGDRWVVLSDPRLVFNDQGEISGEDADILLDLLRDKHPWQDKLKPAEKAEHSFVVSARALTLDYARFFPSVTSLRFDNDGKQWTIAVQLNDKADKADKTATSKPDFASIWRFVPGNASFCVALPVQWQAAEAPLQQLVDKNPALPDLLAALDPVAAICWYPETRLATPLFVAHAGRKLRPEAEKLIENLAQKAWATDGESNSEAGEEGVQRFSNTVASAHGSQRDAEGNRMFETTLVRHDDLFYFSPDRRNVDAALAVAAKRAPALGDEAGLRLGAMLTFDPARLGQLLRADIQEVLPQDEEAYFRGIARSTLWPRLDAWGKQHQAGVLVPGKVGDDGFVTLDFKALGAKD